MHPWIRVELGRISQPELIATAERWRRTRAVFSPTDAELERVRRIADEYERALVDGLGGAITVDGEFVDLPFSKQAKRLLAD
jgi:hypothetical protein